MARKLEERLAEVMAIADAPAAPGASEVLRAALGSKTGDLVAAAASVVRRHRTGELVGELAPAFARLLDRPVKRDPGCRGKAAVARALHALDRWEESVFAVGVGYRQPEPVWGGTEDTAVELRGICGYAFAHSAHSDRLSVLAELLADEASGARAAAARALGDSGEPGAEALLRFKALIGDPDPDVLAGCFTSIFHLAPGSALEFARRFLGGDDVAAAEQAALAIGSSRPAGALSVLVDWCRGDPLGGNNEVGYLALALLRTDDATAFLLDRVADPDFPDRAAHAVTALATFRHDPGLRQRVLEAAGRGHPSMTARVEQAFD